MLEFLALTELRSIVTARKFAVMAILFSGLTSNFAAIDLNVTDISDMADDPCALPAIVEVEVAAILQIKKDVSPKPQRVPIAAPAEIAESRATAPNDFYCLPKDSRERAPPGLG